MSPTSRFFTGFFADAPPISQDKTVAKVNFSVSDHVRTVLELTSSIINTDTLHLDDFILFTSAKVFLDQRPQNTFSKNNAPCVLLSLMLTCPFLNGCCMVRVYFLDFVFSSSSSLVSCSHLSLTASNSNPPYRKMATFH